MIVAERKPLAEIETALNGCSKVLLVGCGGCVTVCLAGGEKEVSILASLLRMSAQAQGRPLEVEEATIQRQCDREFFAEIREQVEECDLVLSLACGVGVNFFAEMFGDKRIVPALNTRFMGAAVAEGMWAERCLGCGDCILDRTGGICPLARCAKSLLNGPCGGSQEGKCEVDPETECAWQLIYERMEQLGRLEELEEILPPKDWSRGHDGGPGKVVREEVSI
ncbi:MAG TPA: hypothetical protein EYP85_16680 [Armatimonadetes bacterium]|nr:hypothetical protein [Armatimonadota bacterium]